MKRISLLTAIAAFAISSVSFGNDSDILASYHSTGGMMPRDYPQTLSVQLFMDGTIQAREVYWDGREKKTIVATVNEEFVNRLAAKASAIPESSLVIPDPNTVMCYDGPVSVVKVRNGLGEMVSLKGESMCAVQFREDGRPFLEVTSAIEGIWNMAISLSSLPEVD